MAEFDKEHWVAAALLAMRDPHPQWEWHWLLRGITPTLKDANKFFLGAILNYQMKTEKVWANAARLSEDIFHDPERLWDEIKSQNPELSTWQSKRIGYALHRFPHGHDRIWLIGTRIVEEYGGDVRNIWKNQTVATTLVRLNALGVGDQISRMIAGALFDAGQIAGAGDVKVDLHVRRVLGRVFKGESFSKTEVNDVLELTRRLHRENPWLLDDPLYSLGKDRCHSSEPACPKCQLHDHCCYYEKSLPT